MSETSIDSHLCSLGAETQMRTGFDGLPADRLPWRWQQLSQRLGRILMGMPSPEAPQGLDESARLLAEIVERAPDLAIFMILSPSPSPNSSPSSTEPTPYGVKRSLQAATAAWLTARRLGWSAERRVTLVKAAFTMNLGMLHLQERLSNQARMADPMQRRTVLAHPMTSLSALKASGVTNPEWLEAVAQHHERPGGGGYPAGVAKVGEMASALRTVDIYTAKLAGRSGRDVLPPVRAARDLLVIERGEPFALALVAEFGTYPPGSVVRLHGGEIAIVVARTADPATPEVVLLTSRRAAAAGAARRREASGREWGIAAPADLPDSCEWIGAERLYSLVF